MRYILNHNILFLFLAFLLITKEYRGQKLFELKDNTPEGNIGQYLEVLEDAAGKLNLREAFESNSFKKSLAEVPNLGVSNKSHWIKFTGINLSEKKDFVTRLSLATIDYVDYYAFYEDGRIDSVKTGDCRPFRNREFERPDFAFKIFLNKNEKVTILFRLSGGEQIQAPISITEQTVMLKSFINADVLMGIYLGIIAVMILYNSFIFFSTKDKSYLFYVFYIVTVGITQLNFLGYTSKYFWPDNLFIAKIAVYFLSSLTAIGSMEFMKRFLNTKTRSPVLHKYFIVFYILYYVAMAFALLKQYNLSYQIIQINASLAATYILFVALKISMQGYRPAKFFLLAWFTFLVGVCVFVLKDLGILPYNNLTYYMMPIGSAFEVILLSFALADRINILTREREDTQDHNLKLLGENKRIIEEQNVLLDSKVKQRTAELELTNKSLNETREQLINVEKMASLGQLTAGISHEINNPINFVVSNVKPLKRDLGDILMLLDKYSDLNNANDLKEKLSEIKDLKEEMDLDYTIKEINLLLDGIEEGANRTAEIVKGLKNFSHIDEGILKKADIHEGVNSTLSILNNNIVGANITIIKNYGVFPEIDCYPGKLNQVFMNVISNAIQAIVVQKYMHGEGTISIDTKLKENNVEIRIKDNGIGIPKANQKKIFDPFFTTKAVGMGTGLGLSIVYGIINSHQGQIGILSEENTGAEFIITLPLQLQRI